MTRIHHPNRRLVNWVIYDMMDRLLVRHAAHFRGVLYDLGCGDQPYRDFFLRHADKYVGVEWSGDGRPRPPDIIADLNRPLPIADEIADTVVSFSVLEHLCEPQTMVSEAWRILRPGGTLVLQVPWQWWIHEAPYDYFRYTPYGLRHLLGKAGFTQVQVEAQCGFFTTMVLKFNYFTNRAVPGPRWIRRFLKAFLVPFWFVGQWLAPYLDRLDKDWELEAQGYFVLAVKPGN